MGSARTCSVNKSFPAAYCSPYKPDVKSLGSSKRSALGGSSGSKEGIIPELGFSRTSTTMEANSYSMQSISIESSSMNCGTDIKGLKKPDKALPCPRCNSLDTKFCYYNNYNVNQPRHFCKGCQRYWTAGGTLRNVAVGAGRRKRKHSSLESESGSEVSSVEGHYAQECVGGFSPSKAGSGDLVHRKPPLLPFDASPFAPGKISSLKMQGSASNELICAKQELTSQHSAGPVHTSHLNRERPSVFHEFIHSKHTVAPSGKHAAPCNSCEHAYNAVEHAKLEVSNVHVDTQRNGLEDVSSQLVLTMPSERQTSNESGCASSLTTQAVSVDLCANEGKSDGVDSKVTKDGERGGSLILESLKSVQNMSCKMAVGGGGGSAVSEFSQCDATDVSHCDASRAAILAPTPLSLKGLLENPAFGGAWGMLSMPLFWGPPADRASLWGFPRGPSASDVDAAKAALIPSARTLQKLQSERIMGLPQKSQTMPAREVSEKSGVEFNAPTRVWVPKTLRIKDADEAARSSIWSTLGIRDRQGSLVSEKTKEPVQCHAKEVGIAAVQSQYANPAALSHSMAFQESN